MLRFLAAIVFVQLASVALVLVARDAAHDWNAWLPIAIALGTISLVTAFWLATLATHVQRDELERQRAEFAREREDLRVQAEREKTRVVRANQKSLTSETRRAESRANRKVALAVAAASGIGVMMVFFSSIALGMLLLTNAGSALAGYLTGRRSLPKAIGAHRTGENPSLARRWLRGPSAPRVND